MSEMKSRCLPTYLVIDTSQSMQPHEALLNKTVDHVFTVLSDSPRVSEYAHVSIITFNTSPHLVLEMKNMEEVKELPMVQCTGRTNYGEMFQLLRRRIDIDVEALNRAGHAVQRPAVFILTDGEPTDPNEWLAAYEALVDPQWRRRPHIISYGFGGANEAVLGRIATLAAYLAVSAADDQEAIVAMLNSLLNTLVASAKAHTLTLPPELPDSYRSVSVAYVE